jgi:mRNA interferase MazF
LVQANDLQTGIPQVIIALITSNMKRSGHPSRVFVPLYSPAGKQSGLQTDSVIATDNLATVRELFVEKVIGNLFDLSDIEKALAYTFALNLA